MVGGAEAEGSSRWRRGRATAHGTCGEFVQGMLSSGEHFNVACSIEKRSSVRLAVRDAAETVVRLEDARPRSTDPLHRAKLCRAVVATRDLLGAGPVEVRVVHSSQLQIGKGMGSSTADIVAATRAFGDALGRPVQPSLLATVATGIEVSDGSMYDDLVAFERRTGSVVRNFGWRPRFLIVMAIPPGSVVTDTVDFADKVSCAGQFDELLEVLEEAANRRDHALLAEAATRSAGLNQRYVPNQLFGPVSDHRKRLGAAGVVIGHTGSLVGLLYPVEGDVPLATEMAERGARDLRRMVTSEVQIELTATASE